MFNSIRARMTVAFSLAFAVLTFTACCALIWYAGYSAKRSTDSTLNAIIRTAGVEFTEVKSPAGISQFIAEEREELQQDNLRMVITDKHGQVVLQSHKKIPFWPVNIDNSWRTASTRVGENSIIIGMPWQRTEAALQHQASVMLILAVFVVAIATAGAWLLVGHTLSPIASLSRQANTASTDQLSLRLQEPSQDAEIVELIATLNGLLNRLSETAALKGRFYSAASHELRTPLQALSGHLELALSRDRTSDEYKRFIEEAHKQADRLMSLVSDLLLLYQLDSAAERPSPQPVDLSAVCRRSLSHLETLIQERKLHIKAQLPETAEIPAPHNHIDILVRNLTENAVKYASEGGNVEISIIPDDKAVRFEIVDDCIFDNCSNTKELFEPFSRPDSSRNSRTGGTGLGLTICKSIADTNGWHLEMHSERTKVRVMLKIPLR